MGTSVDFVIRFQGGGTSDGTHWVDRSLTPGMVGDYRNKPNRRLVKIGRGAQGKLGQKGPIDDVVTQIRSAAGPDESTGAVCIYGNSEGGRMAVDLAVALSAAGIPVEFVGAEDAAMFHEECDLPPIGPPGLPLNDPSITPAGSVRARISVNYYQTKGNSSKLAWHGGPLRWTSGPNMHGEVHGTISGFQFNHDLSGQVDSSIFDARKAHDSCGALGEAANARQIALILNRL